MFWKRKTKLCSCGAAAIGGFSRRPESPLSEIEPVCDRCGKSKLADSMAKFRGRAVVFEPDPTDPCYAYQALDEISNISTPEMRNELGRVLDSVEPKCCQCGAPSNYLWISATAKRGIFKDGFGESFSESAKQTLCAGCCASKIKRLTLPLKFLEICGPSNKDGIQLSMGY
jgi:hypothetical protein